MECPLFKQGIRQFLGSFGRYRSFYERSAEYVDLDRNNNSLFRSYTFSKCLTRYLARNYLRFSCENFRKRCIRTSKSRKLAIGVYVAAICFLIALTIFLAIPKINEEFLSKGFEFFTVYAAVPFLYYLLGFIISSALLWSLKLQRLVFGTNIVTNATPLTKEAQQYVEAQRVYNDQKEKYIKMMYGI